MKLVKLACRITERIRMSPFTSAIRRSRAGSKTRAQSRHCAAREGRAAEPEAEARAPVHSAISVATATPADAPAEAEHEPEVEHHVDAVHPELQHQHPRVRSKAISQPVRA